MRSRYTAYATGFVAYIVRTTHSSGPQFQTNRARWTADIRAFCQAHDFIGLTIHDQSTDGGEGRVHFTANLQQNGSPTVLEEDSLFYRVHDQWLYWGPAPPL